MSYHGLSGYSGHYTSFPNDQNSQYGPGRSSSAASPTMANSYQPANGSEQYKYVANTWSDQKHTARGSMNGNDQSYGNMRWRDGQSQPSTFQSPLPQAHFAMPATTNHGYNGWYDTTTQSQAQSSTQALSNLADASRASVQRQQFYDGRTAARGTVGSEQSASYSGPHAVSETRSPHIPQPTQAAQRNSPFQHHLTPSAASAGHRDNVTPRYNDSPRQQNTPQQQNASTQHHQAPTSTTTHAESNYTKAFSQPQVLSRPTSNFQEQSNHNLNRNQTGEGFRNTYSNGPAFTLPLPQSQGSQSGITHASVQPFTQSNGGKISLLDGASSNLVSPPAAMNVQTFRGAPRQQHEQQPPQMPKFIDPSQVYNPYHQHEQRQRQEETERARLSTAETLDSDGDVRDTQASGATSHGTAAGSETMEDKRRRSKSAGSQQPAASGSPEVSLDTATTNEQGEADMAGELKLMMQRMREWRTKDPALFQKLWEDLKKGGGTGSQPIRGQTPTPHPHLGPLAAQHVANTQTQELPHSSRQHSSFAQVSPQEPGRPATSSDHHPSPRPCSAQTLPQQPTTAQASGISPKASQHQPNLLHMQAESTLGSRSNDQLSMLVDGNGTGVFRGVPPAVQGNRAPTEAVGVEGRKKSSNRSEQNQPKVRRVTVAKQQLHKELQRGSKLPQTTKLQIGETPGQNKSLQQRPLATPLHPPTTGGNSTEAARQALSPMHSCGSTIWPQGKRKALVEAAHKALMGLEVNKGKLSTAEIQALLAQNPSYLELCAELERRGLVFNRSHFARSLLNPVRDLSSSSPSQADPPQQVASPGVASVQNQSLSTRDPAAVVSPAVADRPLANASQSLRTSSAMEQNCSGDKRAKMVGAVQPKSRTGAPSPHNPAPTPGPKEAKARKRNFSELVDLTQLSDDEDEDEDDELPRKEARQEASPENEDIRVVSDINPKSASLSTVAPRSSDMQGHPHGPSVSGPSDRPGNSAAPQSASQSNLQSRFPPHQLLSQVGPPPLHVAPHRSRRLFAKPLNKADALRKLYYNSETIARDILIAAGRHATEERLNAHLDVLPAKYVDNDTDLSTLDWNLIDPGGPPTPQVQVTYIPAGPPKWRIGERLGRGRQTSTSVPSPSQVRNSNKHLEQDHGPGLHSSLARLSSQTATLLQDSLPSTRPQEYQPRQEQSQSQNQNQNQNQNQKQKEQMEQQKPYRQQQRSNQGHQSLNADGDAKSSDTTPHLSKPFNAITHNGPILFTSDIMSAPEHSSMHKSSGPGRPRKSSAMGEAVVPPAGQRRRGRPPGAKNKKSSKVEIRVPTQRQSTTPQYNVYACHWRNCSAELHNLPTLRKHIAKVHKVADDEIQNEGQPCLWKQCRTLEETNDDVVPRVTFNSLSDWSDHVESDHLYPLGMKLGDGPSAVQTGKPMILFETSKYLYHPPAATAVNSLSATEARTRSHTDPQTIARDRESYLCDEQGRTVTASSTKTSIADYPADTLVLSSVAMDAESNTPNHAFSKAHGNDKMDIKQCAVETLVALQKHKEKVGPGLDRGGCTLVNAERRSTLADTENIAHVVDADY